MNGLRRIIGEPLVQFLIIGVALFVTYAAVDRNRAAEPENDTIVVTPGRVAHLVETFTRTWQRPPAHDELEGLIDAYVKEEIYYREGRRLGLDLDDTVFRRRLQQKMEFLMEPSPAELSPVDGELQAFLDANADAFRIPGRMALQQIFFDPQRRGDTAVADAEAALAALRAGGADIDVAEFGDATMLPSAVAMASNNQIAGTFGREFVDGLADLPVGAWSGPIRSTFGLHLVKVDAREQPRDPELSEVLAAVTRDWEADRRSEVAARRFAEIRDRYTVVLQPAPAEAQSVSEP